jgi:hypothetical protein
MRASSSARRPDKLSDIVKREGESIIRCCKPDEEAREFDQPGISVRKNRSNFT